MLAFVAGAALALQVEGSAVIVVIVSLDEVDQLRGLAPFAWLAVVVVIARFTSHCQSTPSSAGLPLQAARDA